MKNLLPARVASYGLLTILLLVIVFHVLVITGIIPLNIVWGGKLSDSSQMITFETVSILVNLLMLTVVAIHAGLISLKANMKVIRIVLWIMFILFLFNTVGNVFSENETEKLIFTPITFILAAFSLRLALEPK